jgi:FKBP-type peptidyl-prolyl cis-trans isomerase
MADIYQLILNFATNIMMPFYLYFLFVGFFFFSSCKETVNNDSVNTNELNSKNHKRIKDQFVKANQQLMQKENDEMDYYAKTHNMAFVKTASGIRYFVYKHSTKGDSIKDGMQITMNFNLKLLDGTECYSSKTEGPKTFVVGHENIESGIHKGVQYLKRGDKAVLLIPSVLAHGLLGDFDKIPPQMPIVYDVEIY